MSSLGRIRIFIKLEGKLDKEIWIFPQRRWMRERGMIVSTKKEQLLLYLLKRGLDGRKLENLRDFRKSFEILFVPNSGREDPEGFTLAKNIPADEDVFIWKRCSKDMDPKSKGWEKLDTNLFSGNEVSGKYFSISSSEMVFLGFPIFRGKDSWIHHGVVRSYVKISDDIDRIKIFVRSNPNRSMGSKLRNEGNSLIRFWNRAVVRGARVFRVRNIFLKNKGCRGIGMILFRED